MEIHTFSALRSLLRLGIWGLVRKLRWLIEGLAFRVQDLRLKGFM